MTNGQQQDLRIHVSTQAGETHTIDSPPDIKVGDFLRELAEGLNLPKIDAEGQPINWTIDSKELGRPLDANKTLAECGINAGHHLYLRRNVIAG
jgi:hypothetical protein